MTFEDHLNLQVSERHGDGVTIFCPIRPEFMNSMGALHGGITAAIADEAGWKALQDMFGKPVDCVTTELKVNYLSPIIGDKAFVRVYIVRVGKTLCVTRMDLFDERNNLTGIAVATYMLV